jgi:hypothetical protein
MTPQDQPRDMPPPDNRTVNFGGYGQAPPPDTGTVHLGGYNPAPGYEAAPSVFAPVPPPEEQASAESLIRFGPGVPDPRTARTIDVWQGNAPGPEAAAHHGRPEEKRRSPGRYILAGLVLLAVVAFLLWQHFATPVSIKSVTVAAEKASLTCGQTELITATLQTNGGSGTVHYQWVRSDGTVSGALTQSVPSGAHQVQLPLRWTVTGQGNFQGTATLKITSPGTATGTAAFNYSCS